MCQSCVEIDKRVERHCELSRSTTDTAEIERVNRLISKLRADRVGCIKTRSGRPPQLAASFFV
jgi:hypothetical protein